MTTRRSSTQSRDLRRAPRGAALCAVLTLLPGSAAVLAEDPAVTDEGEASLGLRQTDQDTRSSFFGTYRDLEDGFIFDFLCYTVNWTGKPWFAEFTARNLMRGDERYAVTFGRRGRFDVTAGFDRTPRLYSREARSVLEADGSRLRLPDQIQADFEALDDTTDATYVTGDTAGTATLAEDLVSATSLSDVGAGRQRAQVGASWRVGKAWTLRFDASSELKTGMRPLGTGSYQRTATGSGAAHSVDRFRALGTELAFPLDERTDRAGAGFHFAHERFAVDFGLEATSFDNAHEAIRWDNPFRATDAASGTFRNRFATGLFDSPPDNTSLSASLTGAVDLPARSRITLTLTQTNTTQDDPFSPWTLNSAISDPNRPGVDVTDPRSLPGDNLDGDVTTTFGSLLFTARPIKPLQVTARYRRYDYANDSREFVWPGYAAFGESAWRTTIVSGVPIENHLQEYTRTGYGVDVTWRIVRPVAVTGTAGRESWDRVERSVESTDEDILGLSLLLDPADWLSVRAGWRTQEREFDGAYDPELEDPDLRQFDQANRDRDAGSLQLQITPGDRVTVGLSYDARKDDYPDSPRGRHQFKGYTSGIDVTVVPTDRVSFYVLGGLDRGETDMRSTAKDDDPDGAGPATTYLVENEWTSEITDETTEIGAGFTIKVVEDKLDLDAGVSRTEGTTEFENANPNPAPRFKSSRLQNSVAVPWPEITTEITSARVKVRYRLTRDMTVGLKWLYEDYDLDDFTWVPVRPYLFNQVNLTTGLTEVRRYLFLDSTYGDYKGSVLSAILQYRF
jgi:MtrB/PioB family decaheme-associated outer membrane protein